MTLRWYFWKEPKNLGWAHRDIEHDSKWRPWGSLKLNVVKYASIIYQWIGNSIWNNFLSLLLQGAKMYPTWVNWANKCKLFLLLWSRGSPVTQKLSLERKEPWTWNKIQLQSILQLIKMLKFQNKPPDHYLAVLTGLKTPVSNVCSF